MNIKFYLLPIFVFVLPFLGAHAQDLREFRVKPDSTISKEANEKALAVKKINVPIPKLELKVNYWKHWTSFGINFNQAQFSDNWKQGGVNSWAVMGLLNQKSEFNRNNFNFTTVADLKYGKLKSESQLAKPNVDRIFWDNKLSYKISKSWAIYTSVTFETQFDNRFTYGKDQDGRDSVTGVISSFMAPGYFTESFGLEFKPDPTFSLRLGTGTARQTLVLDNRLKPYTGAQYYARYGKYLDPNNPDKGTGAKFGVEEGKVVKNDLAFQITADLNRNLAKNLNLKARYNLFADYRDIDDPSHRLDATFSSKVTSLINVSLGGTVLYDNNLDGKVQWSEALAVGVLFNFPK